jgi:hypothetical protein
VRVRVRVKVGSHDTSGIPVCPILDKVSIVMLPPERERYRGEG